MMACEARPLELDNDGKSALDCAISSPIQRVLVDPQSPSSFGHPSPVRSIDFAESDSELSPIPPKDQPGLLGANLWFYEPSREKVEISVTSPCEIDDASTEN